jgi:hypothetical protein
MVVKYILVVLFAVALPGVVVSQTVTTILPGPVELGMLEGIVAVAAATAEKVQQGIQTVTTLKNTYDSTIRQAETWYKTLEGFSATSLDDFVNSVNNVADETYNMTQAVEAWKNIKIMGKSFDPLNIEGFIESQVHDFEGRIMNNAGFEGLRAMGFNSRVVGAAAYSSDIINNLELDLTREHMLVLHRIQNARATRARIARDGMSRLKLADEHGRSYNIPFDTSGYRSSQTSAADTANRGPTDAQQSQAQTQLLDMIAEMTSQALDFSVKEAKRRDALFGSRRSASHADFMNKLTEGYQKEMSEIERARWIADLPNRINAQKHSGALGRGNASAAYSTWRGNSFLKAIGDSITDLEQSFARKNTDK